MSDEIAVRWHADKPLSGTMRLFINVAADKQMPDYEQSVLDDLCFWGGSDRRYDCADGSTMLSWEFSEKMAAVLPHLLARWGAKRGWLQAEHSEVWKN